MLKRIQFLVIIPFVVQSFSGFALTAENPLPWYEQSQKEKTMGVGLSSVIAKGYLEKAKNEVIVAVIDDGIDIHHEAFVGKLWTNPKEIAGNNIDDDQNGYIDDIHGWNFCGYRKADGSAVNVLDDTLEITRQKIKSQNLEAYSEKEKSVILAGAKAYDDFLKVSNDIVSTRKAKRADYEVLKKKFIDGKLLVDSDFSFLALKDSDENKLKGQDAFLEKLKTLYHQKNNLLTASVKQIKKRSDNKILDIFKKEPKLDVEKLLSYLIRYKRAESKSAKRIEEKFLKLPSDGKKYEEMYQNGYLNLAKTVDPYKDIEEELLGNNDIAAMDGDISSASHGTHVAGSIAGLSKTFRGIAPNVKLMNLRAVVGDERDKHVAAAIRYAVDNGARIISMSFGKTFSDQPELVKEATAYAEKKGVLMVHAAGNDSVNTEKQKFYPNAERGNGTKFSNWIEVGASSSVKGKGLAGDFSNFGKHSVDVFSPGVKIISSVPTKVGSKTFNYEEYNGTSMATPVVSGVAAFLLGLDPSLTAVELKHIIEKSAIKVPRLVYQPSDEVSKKNKQVFFGSMSKTGGVVNLERAIKYLESHSEKK